MELFAYWTAIWFRSYSVSILFNNGVLIIFPYILKFGLYVLDSPVVAVKILKTGAGLSDFE